MLRLYDALLADRPEGVVELVPAARTLLVAYDDDADLLRRRVRRDRGQLGAGARDPAKKRKGKREQAVEVPVRYDGPDLARVAELTGLDEAEVVERHTAGDYRSGFCGFAPGFAYLTGLDESLHVPRRDDPRTKVRAGRWGWPTSSRRSTRVTRRAAGS